MSYGISHVCKLDLQCVLFIVQIDKFINFTETPEILKKKREIGFVLAQNIILDIIQMKTIAVC